MIGQPPRDEQIDKALAKAYTFLLELACKKVATVPVVDSPALPELYQLNTHPKYNKPREKHLVNRTRGSKSKRLSSRVR